MTTRTEHAAVALLREVNRIACDTEDMALIRNLIAEARIEPGTHVGNGEAPGSPFWTDQTVAEWALGNWAHCIDGGFWGMNTVRNVSMSFMDRIDSGDYR